MNHLEAFDTLLKYIEAQSIQIESLVNIVVKNIPLTQEQRNVVEEAKHRSKELVNYLSEISEKAHLDIEEKV